MSYLSISLGQNPEYKCPVKPRVSYTVLCSASASSHSFPPSPDFEQLLPSTRPSWLLPPLPCPSLKLNVSYGPLKWGSLHPIPTEAQRTSRQVLPPSKWDTKILTLGTHSEKTGAFSRPPCPNLPILFFPNSWSSGQNQHPEIRVNPYYFR